MKKVVLCTLLLCAYMAAISQNPLLLKDVAPGSAGSSIQQIVKTGNYSLSKSEDAAAETDRSLLRLDGEVPGTLKHSLTPPTYNSVSKDYSFNPAAVDTWGVVGSATPNGWGAGPDIPLTYNATYNTWSATVSLTNGEIKFRKNNDWAVNYGDNGADGTLDANGSNIVVTAGTYLITLDFTTLNYSILSPLVNIPDPNFEQALIDLGIDKDAVVNASISRSDAEAITELNVTGKNISSFQGIEAFKNLSRFFCQNNQVQLLDISKNTALTVLECGGNQLTGLNVTKNSLLKTLGFGFNNITKIDVSQNLKLEVFWANNNQITSLNLDLNPALTVVGLSNNPLTFVSLKNGNNTKIVYFEASGTPQLTCITSDAVVPASMTNSGKTFSENCAKAYYVNDQLMAGDIFTSAPGNNANTGTKASPFATLTYALSQAVERDTIYVDAGNYTEQVTIEKGITVNGAGSNLTSILTPAVTVAPPGFVEKGVFQTAPNIGDVHIRDLSITGNLASGITPIVIQTGGSVKNCILQNGNQGIFVRIDPATNLATKTFVVDGNSINAEYIAVNFAGTRLTATLTNNTIAAFNSTFSSGTWAGTEFGTLGGLTIAGNTFSSYAGDGLYINSNNCTISQNSFLGTGLKAINKFGGNTINASCNWYGSALAVSVASKISSGVTYSPWLIDGTDNNSAVGFQTSATCPVANSYYVNDNNTTGDVYTIAMGNDANAGTFNAPFATLNYAITQVPTGATIYVDAGTYIERVIVNKSVYLKGAYAAVNPGNLLSRGISESILIPFAENNSLEIMTIQSPNVTVDGFLFNGDNPSLTGSITLNGVDVNAGMAIFNGNLQTDNLVVKNNIMKNFYRYGLLIQKNTGSVTIGNKITQNRIDNISSRDVRDGRAVGFFANSYGAITNNVFTRVHSGVVIANLNTGTTADSLLIANNKIEAYSAAINVSNSFNYTSPIRIKDNQLSLADLSTWVAPGSSTVNYANGIVMGGISSTKIISLENNTLTGFRNGIFPSSINTPDGLLISGGSISNSPGVAVFYNGQDPVTAKLTLTNLSLQNNDVGIDVSATDNTVMPVEFSGVTVTGGAVGLRVYSPKVTLAGNALTGISFANQSNNYIMLTYNAFTGLTIDATSVSFDGLTGASMTLAQRFAVENKIVHRIDYNGGGFIRIKADEAYVTPNSFISTLPVSWGTPTTSADINRAIASVSNGNMIYVDAGTYAQDLVIDKSVTLLGAKAGINPGTSLDRGSESILVSSSTDAVNTAIVRLNASNIIIDGFTIDGDKPGTSSGVTLNGNDIDAGIGIGAGLLGSTSCNNITIRNNIIKNTYRYGIFLQAPASTSLNNNLVTQNHIDNISAQNVAGNFGRWGRAVGLSSNGYGSVSNNIITRSSSGVWFLNASLASASAQFITGNIIETYRSGVEMANFSGTASSYLINQNEFSTADLNSWNVPGSSTTNNNIAVRIFSMLNNTAHSILNNKITGTAIGVLTAGLNNSAGQTLLVNNNSILQTAEEAIYNDAGGDGVNASCNWYGSAAAQDFIQKLTLATVDIAPWLTNGTDNDAATGFQPVPNSCDGYPTLITLNGSTNATCNGAANGSINITTTYGKAPYTYTWTKEGDANFVSHDEDPTGLLAGIYHLAILDGNGANIYITDPEANGPGTITVTITEPDVLTASANGTNLNCFGDTNGTVSSSASGGTAPYSYSWSNGSTTQNISGVAASVYTVTITDANGCTTTASYEVTQPDLLTANATGTNVSCNGGNNGTATVNVSGGSGPYSYLWSNGATTQNISDLTAGTYTVIVTDANGCIATSSYEVTQPSAIIITIGTITNTCTGASGGSISSNAVGGTGILTYSWTGPNGFTKASKNISNLAGGTYTLTVTDANGCTATTQATVNALPSITATVIITDVTCFSTLTGAINLTPGGGSGTFSFSWTGPNGFKASTEDIGNIKAGSYSVTITDAAGCSAFNSYTVGAPTAAVSLTVQKTDAVCATGGTLTITGNGGRTPYTYSINGSVFQSSNIFSNVAAGTYNNITIKDNSGCTTVAAPVVINNTDVYEVFGNEKQDTKLTGTLISFNQSVAARISPTATDKDWYNIKTGAVLGTVTVSLTHPSINYTFNLYDGKGKQISPSSTTATTKTYNAALFTSNTVYSIQVIGTTASSTCYTLLVSSTAVPLNARPNSVHQTEITVVTKLIATIYPNPHNGNFTLSIESPEDGVATVEMFTVTGQKLSERKANVVKGKGNTVKYSNMNYAILFYKVSIGKQVATGKIISPN